MYTFVIRYRYPNGGWGETRIQARNVYEASQQANAMFGSTNVLSVWQDNIHYE